MTTKQNNNRTWWLIGGIVGGLLFITLSSVMWFMSVRNTFISDQENINAAWAQVENQLQRRFDLIPNLVNTVKGYAKHEQTVFDNIAAARAKLSGAKTVGDKIAAANNFESSISRLLMVVENYPNLKADQQFTRLMDELAGSENRLSVERRRYNEMINTYNKNIRIFPRSFVAQISNFEKMPYFESVSEAKAAPNVAF